MSRGELRGFVSKIATCFHEVYVSPMSAFKIAAAQIAVFGADVARNIAIHTDAISAAAKHHVDILIFPELSLTGYELDMAAELALDVRDPRLQPILELAEQHQLDVVFGAPLLNGKERPLLGAIVAGRDGTMRTYSKMHLGGNEPRCFSPGETPVTIHSQGQTVGLAICADASQPSHPRNYSTRGAGIYGAGVFLTDEWYATDVPRLANYSGQLGMLVVMANHGASQGTLLSVGKSAIWSPAGELLAMAVGKETALVIATNFGAVWTAEVVGI